MPRHLSEADLSGLVPVGSTVFVAGGTGEPSGLLEIWRQARSLDGVTLIGLQIPGLNRVSPEEFGNGCRFRTHFLAPGLRRAFAKGLVDLQPMHHAGFYHWLQQDARIDLAVFQVS